MDDAFILSRVKLYPLLVWEEAPAWPEHKVRQRFWFSAKVAIDLVEEPDLRKVLAALNV